MRSVLCLSLCLIGLGAALASPARRSLWFVDSQTNSYFAKSDAPVSVDYVESLMARIIGVKAKSSEQAADSLVEPSIKRPSAHCVLNVAGLASEDVQDVFAEKEMHEVQAPSDAASIAAISDALSYIAEANPSLDIIMLDEQGLSSCKSNCLEEQRDQLSPLMDTLVWKEPESINEKLFSIELSSFLSGLNAQVTRQDTAEMALEGDVQIIEATLVSLNGLSDESPEVQSAAKKAVKALLKASILKLDTAYGGDITYQFNGFSTHDEPSAGGKTVQEIMGWKMNARRRLQANAGVSVTTTSSSAPFPPLDQNLASKKFSTKAAGYGAFIILLYCSFAAVYCMCFMPIKHDTLLFGAKKTN